MQVTMSSQTFPSAFFMKIVSPILYIPLFIVPLTTVPLPLILKTSLI